MTDGLIQTLTNREEMKQMEKQHIIFQRLIGFALLLMLKLVCLGSAPDNLDSFNQMLVSKSAGTGLSELSVASNIDESVTNGLIPIVDELLRNARKASLQLDSIEELQMHVTTTEAIKKYFVYEGGKLKESRFLHNTLGRSVFMDEQRKYNENEQIQDYQKFEDMLGHKDGLLLTEHEEYSYEKGRIKTYRHTTVGTYYDQNKTENGVFYPAGTAIYKILTKYYEYNDAEQTIRISDSDNIEFTILHLDSIGRTKIEYYYEYNADQSDSTLIRTFHYYYSETDSSRHMILEDRFYTDFYDKGYHSSWHYIDFWEDTQGRDSVFTHVYLQEGLEDHPDLITRIEYKYINDKLSHASLIVPAIDYQMDSLIELGHFDYTYDANSLVTNLLQTFYDERIQQWTTYADRSYFYSPIQSTKADQLKQNAEFGIYPNPASDHITVQIKNSTQAQYQIYDLYGRQLLNGSLENNTIDVSELVRGTYMLKIVDDNSINVQRFIKQ